MTISSSTNKVINTANGSQTVFDFSFKTFDESHIKPYLDDVEQTTGFTVNLNSDQDNTPGGDVTFDTAPADGVVVAIVREVPLSQQVDYQAYDPFPAETHEKALDKLTMQNQQQQEELDRTTKASISDDGTTDYTWPPYDAGKAISWDESSRMLTNSNDKVNDITDTAQQSADDAAASAVAADSSAQDADATLKDFETKYLGAKTDDPTVDNEGNPLIDGALYWNTTENRMRVYDLGNTRWTDASGSTSTFYQYSSTVTGQTVITGIDDNGENLSYTIGYIQVSYNGQILKESDYTETDKNTITLADGIKEDGDTIQILSFGTFDVANSYTKNESDDRYPRKGYGGIELGSPVAGLGTLTTTPTKIPGSAYDNEIASSPVAVDQDLANGRIRINGLGMWQYTINITADIVPITSNSSNTVELVAYNETDGVQGDQPFTFIIPRYGDSINISGGGLIEIDFSNVSKWWSLYISVRNATPSVDITDLVSLEISAFRVG